jgi:hypothetical protein
MLKIILWSWKNWKNFKNLRFHLQVLCLILLGSFFWYLINEIIHHIANTCMNTVCQNGGTPTAIGSSCQCTCPCGYSGTNCQTYTSPCSKGPCLNGGSCTATGCNSYTCSCPSEFSGINCQTCKQSLIFGLLSSSVKLIQCIIFSQPLLQLSMPKRRIMFYYRI